MDDLPNQLYIVGTHAYYDRLDSQQLIDHVRSGVVGAAEELRRRVESFAAERFDLSCRVCLACGKQHAPVANECEACGTESLAFLTREDFGMTATKTKRAGTKRQRGKGTKGNGQPVDETEVVIDETPATVKGLVNGEAVWECPECNKLQSPSQPSCVRCHEGHRPDLTGEQRKIVWLLEPDRTERMEWVKLREQGEVSDFFLQDRICRLIELSPNGRSTDLGPIYGEVVDDEPCVWFTDGISAQGPPTLNAFDLVMISRRLWCLPGGAEGTERQSGKETKGKAAAKSTDSQPSTLNSPPSTILIDVDAIGGFPWNCRDEHEFDGQQLQELGESLKRKQLQAIAVKPAPELGDGAYVGIFGERRWRAAQRVGLKQLRAEVHDVDEATAVEMVGTENEDREDWSPIAQAKWLAAMKEHHGLSDRDLAKRVGMSQSQATNIMGLLKLPAEWQRLLIARAITATAVRPLLPFAEKRPQVLEKAATSLRLPGSGTKSPRSDDEDPITLRDVEEATLQAVNNCTRSLNPDEWSASAPKFSVTKKRKEELDVEKLKVNRWQGPVNRAWNVTRWNELQKDAKAKLAEKENAAKKADGGKRKAVKEKKPETPDPRQLRTAWTAWQQEQLAARLEKKLTKGDKEFLVRWVLGLLLVDGDMAYSAAEAVHGRSSTYADFPQIYAKLLSLPAAEFSETAAAICRKFLAESMAFTHCEIDGSLDLPAAHFGIDAEAAWLPDDSFLQLLSIEQLTKMAADAEIFGPGFRQLPPDVVAKGKEAAITWLLEKWPKKPAGVPAVLRLDPGK